MAHSETQTDLLFASLAEQIKLPLVQIRHAAEGLDGVQAETIDVTAQAALRLIDGYLLSAASQEQLQLAPVPVSSLLYDTAEVLRDYASLHDCEIELDVAGRYEPVMSERKILQTALISLGYGFISAMPAEKGRKSIKLSVRRRGNNIITGVYAANNSLHSSLLKRARALQGKSHQPLAGFASDNGAGVLIADRLIKKLGSDMRVSKAGGLYGLAASLEPSRQLSLV